VHNKNPESSQLLLSTLWITRIFKAPNGCYPLCG
jgi:hypothetical protein